MKYARKTRENERDVIELAINFEVISLRDGKPFENRAITRTTRAKLYTGVSTCTCVFKDFKPFPYLPTANFNSPRRFNSRSAVTAMHTPYMISHYSISIG